MLTLENDQIKQEFWDTLYVLIAVSVNPILCRSLSPRAFQRNSYRLSMSNRSGDKNYVPDFCLCIGYILAQTIVNSNCIMTVRYCDIGLIPHERGNITSYQSFG